MDRLKLREIDAMVTGAQAGDHFFFACRFPLSLNAHLLMIDICPDSGHSSQMPNRRNSEEDGKDECLSCRKIIHMYMPLTVSSPVIISCDRKNIIDNVSYHYPD